MLPKACLIAIALTVAVTRAWGGCAWVLWENAVMIVSVSPTKVSSSDWKMSDCFQTPEACQKSRDLVRQISHATHSEHIGVQYSKYECFPDSVDPRGPKGK